ncbi:MAG TPA: Bax inhibitor-1 family protein [Opitutaceae bacterium]|nr:Bax inhibitor-1 family protein [Opitutaceae bacterium]
MTSSTRNPFVTVAESSDSDRALFIRRTYLHLAGAIIAFIGLEYVLLNSQLGLDIARLMLSGQYSWLIVLGSFMAVSWLADKWARSNSGPAVQYLGLGLYTVAQAIIFLPLMFMAAHYSSPDVIPMAGIITGLLFAGLTATAFLTRKDFSFLRSILTIGGFVALGVVACSILFGFNLGLFFSSVMVLFAGGSILYTTSNIIHHYRPNQHVAASLALFSGVMLLLWYVLQILMRMRR